MRTHVYFNGIDLTRDFYVSDLRMPLLPVNVNTRGVSGRDGSVYCGSTLAQRSMLLTLTVKDEDIERRQAAARRLASALAVEEPKPLALSIDGGLYYMAMPTSGEDGLRRATSTRYDVEFVCPDPVAYGRQVSVAVPSTGTKSATFVVGGTYEAMPVVTAPIASADEGDFWKLALEDGSYLYYEPTYTGAAYTETLVADCAERTLKADGHTRLLIPQADWLVLTPGQHTLTLSGDAASGDVTVTYRERWL